MLGYPKRFLSVSNVRVAHYNQGSGPSVLLLHGLPTSCFLWRDVIAALRRTYHLVAPDLLGLGDSSGSMETDHSLPAQARVMEGLMSRLDMEDVIVVGHDVGGAVAQILALSEPRRVKGLVLVSSAAYDNWPVPVIRKLQRMARWKPVWQTAVRAGMTRALGFAEQGFIKGVKFPGNMGDQEIEEYLRPHRLSNSSREHLRRFLLALDNRCTIEAGNALGRLHVPTLIVWGADDAFLAPTWGQRLAADLRVSQLRILNDCGHFVPEERAGELAGLIDSFARRRLQQEQSQAGDP